MFLNNIQWRTTPFHELAITIVPHRTMKKYKVLQLGFLVAIDTFNSWYLYGLEC
jgi:hypothetical protein